MKNLKKFIKRNNDKIAAWAKMGHKVQGELPADPKDLTTLQLQNIAIDVARSQEPEVLYWDGERSHAQAMKELAFLKGVETDLATLGVTASR